MDRMTTPATTPADGMSQQDARFAIDGAIAYGRMGTNEPSAGHWLTEYWHIGRQLAKLGETSAWDNQTPVATTEPDLDALEAEWAPYAHDLGSAAIIVGLIARIRVLSLATPSPGKAQEPVAWHIGNADGTINRIGAVYIRRSLAEKHIASYEEGEIDAAIVPLYASPEKAEAEKDTVYLHDAGDSQIGGRKNPPSPSGYLTGGDGGGIQTVFDPQDGKWKARQK